MSAQPKAGSEPAFPNALVSPTNDGYLTTAGLTKRELFAAMVMQGFASDPNCDGEGWCYARTATGWADALIAELEKAHG